jgi:PPOX class probable F420-dependent enzyme
VFDEEQRAFLNLSGFAMLGTIARDGSPHLTKMWHRCADDILRMIAPASAVKVRNLSADPRVSVIIEHPSNGYDYLDVRGHADVVRDDSAARAELRLIAARYVGARADAFVAALSADPRVLIVVHPHRVRGHIGGRRP